MDHVDTLAIVFSFSAEIGMKLEEHEREVERSWWRIEPEESETRIAFLSVGRTREIVTEREAVLE